MLRTTTCLILLAFGCATDATLGETEQRLGKNPGDNGIDDEGCPSWGCGSNSPVMEVFSFWDLNETGRVNAQGFRITKFRKYWQGAWREYRPDVFDGQLRALNKATLAVVHEGAAVQGAVFEIENVNTSAHYEMVVVEVGRTPYWVQPYATTSIQSLTYHLMWRYPPDPSDPVTTGPPLHELCGQALENDGMDEFFAVLFDDDRIDADNIKVTGEQAYWFNIGCKSHALAKQHLMGHTKAANHALHFTTTIDQRTANLKALSGDYCGIGAPMTVPGQPLKYHDAHTGYDIVGNTAGSIEARWTKDGAACLNVPRVDYKHTALGDATFPHGINKAGDPDTELPQWCAPPPPCADADRTHFNGADIITLNPFYLNLPPGGFQL